MNKKYFHHLWMRLRPIKTWYFFVAFLLCGTLGVVALRDNYLTMVDLREKMYQADESGQNVELALQDLRAHVNAHMNTSLSGGSDGIYPPIHLKGTYERLQKAEQDRVNTVNSKVYTEAQAHCERLYPSSFSGGPRVPCIEQYVKEHGTTKQAIPDALYKFDFASPRWSPDLAGWLLALSGLFLVLGIVRFLLGRLLKAASH
jgi:hypothetical protein